MFTRKNSKNNKEELHHKSAKFSTIDRIAADTVIEGKITSARGIRIDGVIKGTVECKGKLVIGKTGVVSGNIICDSADIEGRIDSSLVKVKNLLHLRPTCDLVGDIVSGNLTVDNGAKFSGSCKIEAFVTEELSVAEDTEKLTPELVKSSNPKLAKFKTA